MKIRPCWSCGSEAECYPGCECAKCIDPEGYELWKREEPGQYRKWLKSQRIDGDEEDDYEEDDYED